MPSTSSQDAAIKAIHDFTYAIKHPTAATPTLLLEDDKTHALETLARVFNSAISQPVPSRVKDTIQQEPRVIHKEHHHSVTTEGATKTKTPKRKQNLRYPNYCTNKHT